MLLLAGCIDDAGQVAIRSSPAPISAVAKPVPARVAEGEGLLALGNIGLALEAFRKAHRDDPLNTRALVGLAQSYDQMGRPELSARYYEQALAIAPADGRILDAFARSLEAQGNYGKAEALRSELALRQNAQGPAAPPIVAGSEQESPSQSVSVRLPKADQKLEPAQPTASRGAQQAQEGTVESPRSLAPRLERVSLAEVALVTTPRWRAEVVERTGTSTTVRFVPLKPRQDEGTIRLLNAARHQGLAARTRLTLNRKGWSRVSIGDADSIRQKSLILYSQSTAADARRLASQFGFPIAKVPRPGRLTVLLGRDAIGRRPATA